VVFALSLRLESDGCDVASSPEVVLFPISDHGGGSIASCACSGLVFVRGGSVSCFRRRWWFCSLVRVLFWCSPEMVMFLATMVVPVASCSIGFCSYCRIPDLYVAAGWFLVVGAKDWLRLVSVKP
jgi:hypothetical protein